jgi:ribose/xylose/arabinose/galactoside ABC-type transport system permease subunit
VRAPAFRSAENLAVVAQDAGILGILACGEALVILTGGIDLSVGSALALSACLGGALMMHGTPWPLACIASLAAGAATGAANGTLITYRRLPPILVTLATLLLFRGVTNVLTGAAPYNVLPDSFKSMGRGYLPFAAFVVVALAASLAVNRSRLGRHVVAVGGSEPAARLSGIAVGGVLRRVYVLAGVLAAVAGLLMAAANGNAQWTLADGWELDVIAAVVIGGVRLTGGEGSVAGAGVGAMIIVVLRNALFLSGVPVERYGLVTGGVILIAALTEQWRRRAERRR